MGNGLCVSQLLSFEDMRRVCAETGAGVELIDLSIAENLDDAEATVERLRRALAAFACAPEITVHGPFLDLNPASWDSFIEKSTERRFAQAYDAARLLGAKKIVFHTGFYPRANFIQGWAEREAAFFSRFMENRTAMQVVLENLFDPRPEPLMAVYEHVNNPCFKLCLDIGHAHCYSAVPVTEWAGTLLPAIGYVHLHDNDGYDPSCAAPDRHLALGEGSLPLDALFAILRRGSDITYTIECADVGRVMRSHDVWARLACIN